MAWCVIYLGNNINLTNISELVKQNGYPRKLRDTLLDWIMKNYFEIYREQNQSLRECEEFLVKNIEVETIARISAFLAGDSGWGDERGSFIKSYQIFALLDEPLSCRHNIYDEAERKAREVFEKETMQLRGAIHFVKESWKEMMKKKKRRFVKICLMSSFHLCLKLQTLKI